MQLNALRSITYGIIQDERRLEEPQITPLSARRILMYGTLASTLHKGPVQNLEKLTSYLRFRVCFQCLFVCRLLLEIKQLLSQQFRMCFPFLDLYQQKTGK